MINCHLNEIALRIEILKQQVHKTPFNAPTIHCPSPKGIPLDCFPLF